MPELLTHWGGRSRGRFDLGKRKPQFIHRSLCSTVDELTGEVAPVSLNIASTIEQSDLRPELLDDL